jgi:phosphonate transport system substrate-binding protein
MKPSSSINRRIALAGLGSALACPSLALAQSDWRRQFPELRLGVSSAENEANAMSRNEPFAKYLSTKMGVPVRAYRTADYAGLVEGMRSGNIEFARFGPAVYSLGRRVIGEKLTPLLRDVDNNGAEGYYSVIIVKSDSAFRSIEDLKGRVLTFADPNSTSGYAFPRYFLRKQGFDPAIHFKATPFSGGHENSVRAVVAGQYEAGAVFWTNEQSGIVQRLEARNQVPKGSTRIIWTSPLIPNSPFCARGDLPKELVNQLVAAMFSMKVDGPEAWEALNDGQVSRYAPAKHEDYLDVVAVIEELDRERKSRSGG